MLKKISLSFTYIFYAVILLVVLLVVRFPKESLLARIEAKVEHELPGYTCTINDIKYGYPINVLLEGVNISHPGRQIQLPETEVTVTPDLKNLLTTFKVSMDVYGGTLSTDVIVHSQENQIELPRLEISATDLEGVGFLAQSLGRGIQGKLELSGRYLGNRNRLLDGEFSGTVRISDFEIELKRPILQSKQVVFSELSSFIQVKNTLVELGEGNGVGPFYDGAFSGSVKLKRLWRASVLDVAGTLSPRQEYLEENRQVARAAALLYKKYKRSTIPFQLTGTMEDPLFAFGEK